MDSDGAKRVKIKGSSKPDEYGVFVGEVLWDQNKKKAKKSFIHVELTPIPEGSDGKIKEKEKISFASSSPSWYIDIFDGIDNDQPQESFGYLEFPFFHNEKKPIPLMIMVHSSSGKKIHRKWHVFMHKLGVATFEPRVFEPRKSERNIYLKGEDKEYDQYTTSVTKDCRLHILENGHEVFQLGKDKEYDVTTSVI